MDRLLLTGGQVHCQTCGCEHRQVDRVVSAEAFMGDLLPAGGFTLDATEAYPMGATCGDGPRSAGSLEGQRSRGLPAPGGCVGCRS